MNLPINVCYKKQQYVTFLTLGVFYSDLNPMPTKQQACNPMCYSKEKCLGKLNNHNLHLIPNYYKHNLII